MRNTLQLASALTASALAVATIVVMATVDAGRSPHDIQHPATSMQASAFWDRG
jgi:hypothetical protein